MSIKERRKALGWSRQELASRAGIDRYIVQQLEMGSWNEGEARMRVEVALERAESGESDVQLDPIQVPSDAPKLGSDGGG